MTGFPFLRVLAGSVFILAGLFAYYGVSFGVLFAFVLVIAGAFVILVTLVGHRAHPLDIAVFIVALLILGGVSSGIGATNSNMSGPPTIQYIALKAQTTPSINEIDLFVKTNSSSINVQFSDNTSLLYQVKFVRGASPFIPPFFLSFVGRDTYSLTNQTKGGILFLNLSASFRSISAILPSGYLTKINASTGAGSINVDTAHEESIEFVSLSTGSGSIDANISSNRISDIDLSTGAGSVALKSNYFGPAGSKIPISISTGAGSATLDIKIPSNASALIDASTGVGSISHTLSSSFTVSQSTSSRFVASEGNVNTSLGSFEISLSTGTGSINIKAQTI